MSQMGDIYRGWRDQLEDWWDLSAFDFQPVVDAWVRKSQEIAPVGINWGTVDGVYEAERGGDLKSSLGGSYRLAGGVVTLTLSSIFYGEYVVYGAPGRTIYPSAGKALRFYWKKEGRPFKGRIGQGVNWPGIQANPFVWRAWESAEVQSAARNIKLK
jgi:hypothetical protein